MNLPDKKDPRLRVALKEFSAEYSSCVTPQEQSGCLDSWEGAFSLAQPPQPQANPSAQKLEMVSWPEKYHVMEELIDKQCMLCGREMARKGWNECLDDCTLAREALIQEHLKEVGRLKDGLIKIRMAIHQIDGKKKSHEYIDALCKEVLGKEG